MSDGAQGPGWWLASDGKWYSPEQAPGYVTPPPDAMTFPVDAVPAAGAAPAAGPPVPPPSYGMAPVAPGYGPPSGPPGYPPPTAGYGYGYGAGSQPYGYLPVRKTNGLAIASLACSFFFWIYGLGAVLAIIFGFIARSQIKKSGDVQQGKGLALAGIIIGMAGIVIGIILVVVVITVVHHCDQSGSCTFNTSANGN